MKSLYIRLILVLMIIMTAAIPVNAAQSADLSYASIFVYGNKLDTDVPPAVINGRVLAPFRAVFESLGAEVTWDYDLNMAIAKRGNNEIQLIVDQPVAWVNKQKVRLDVAPMIISSRIMVPVRFISETWGESVRWDEKTRSVYIGKDAVPEDTNWTQPYNLNSDSSLAYQAGKTALFQTGTQVTMRSKDFIASGTLKDDTELPLPRSTSAAVVFQGGRPVSFNQQGCVIKGTLARDTWLEYIPLEQVDASLLPYRNRNKVLIKQGSAVELDDKGYLRQGVLAADSNVVYNDKGYVSLKADTEIVLAADGMLKQGVLNNKAVLTVGSSQLVDFKAGTAVEFSSRKLVKGTLDGDFELRYREGYDSQPVLFAGDTAVELNEQGYVRQGVLAEDASLCYQERKFAQFKEKTAVQFYSNGLLHQGCLATSAVLPVSPAEDKSFAANTLVTFDSSGYAAAQ